MEGGMGLTLPSHKTKIVCTIGPASRSRSVLKELIESGMNVARLNLSHGSLEEHREDIRHIRSVSAGLGRLVLILVDLPGPKIRVGRLDREPLELKKGDIVTLTTEDVLGRSSLIPVSYERLPESVSRGSTVYLNDGFIQLRVQGVAGSEVRCKVMVGGDLLSHKGLNLPKARIFAEPVTEKELALVDFGLKEGVNAFSVSFVEKAEDILKVKEFARKKAKPIHVVAKIERAEAVKNIGGILQAADAIMIARGDLGVQIPIEHVPAVQKSLIRKSNLRGLPVITATQMLHSMTDNSRPTRAEAADVANAILDGTDAVMLSEETAIGKYPVETVRMMARIARSIERQRRTLGLSSGLEGYFKDGSKKGGAGIEDVISLNAVEAVRALPARFILTLTESGSTPRRISRFKPDCWILSFSRNEATHNFSALSYGVHPFLVKNEVDDWHEVIMKTLRELRLIRKDDKLVLAERAPGAEAGTTDSLRIITVS